MNSLHIKTFEGLISFIEDTELPIDELNKVLIRTLKIISVDIEATKEQLIERLIKFWAKWKDSGEWPLFLESDLYDNN